MTVTETFDDLALDDEPAAPSVEITEPGVYEIDEATYHADPVVGGSLSSTGARVLANDTPARFDWDRRHGRLDKREFDLGRAAHREVLGVGAGIAEVRADSWRTKAAKEAAAGARAEGMTPLLTKDVDRVEAMAAALRDHEQAGPLLARTGRAEQCMVYRDPESGVMCRVLIDWLPDVDDDARLLVVDYKTTTDSSRAGVGKSLADWGYYQQGAFYTDAPVVLGLAHELPPKFVLVAQEKDPPYLVGVHPIADTALDWGRVLNRAARDVYRGCTEAGHWPGHPLNLDDLDLPGWHRARLEAREAAGDFDTTADLMGDDPE